MATEYRNLARSGQISWVHAAEQASHVRNLTLEAMRGRSTPVGRAIAERMKLQGVTLNEMIARKTQELYGNTRFQNLTSHQQNQVFAKITEAAGRSNPRITSLMRNVKPAARGLIVLSLGLSIYTIATSDDKVGAAKKEAAIMGSGVMGGMAGGAIAGLACGPGAPVCVTVGAFIGGGLAAFGVSYFW